ncbi:unnamed protein product [Vitrella brassicaformis CCMP3155]|uniref:Uncharacterized protein n=1 Tax=Vitrella brassicaformis (strain CCMP3155) TaxID=1169540 RepID=A0A0G4H353_VITBC|nr:unnamed protein product [Vitrella brassicaformis CCMP3155]|eukprot:CEM38130.1 unnamed protein product [Vitrella brassicaformis CCMP3155]
MLSVCNGPTDTSPWDCADGSPCGDPQLRLLTEASSALTPVRWRSCDDMPKLGHPSQSSILKRRSTTLTHLTLNTTTTAIGSPAPLPSPLPLMRTDTLPETVMAVPDKNYDAGSTGKDEDTDHFSRLATSCHEPLRSMSTASCMSMSTCASLHSPSVSIDDKKGDEWGMWGGVREVEGIRHLC